MKLFDRISKYRYHYPNKYSSVKFIDYMITDLKESVEFKLPKDLENLGKVIHHVFGYSRYEPTNPYAFHKNVPAARNVHANEAYLICDGNVCRYNCKKDMFECITYCQEEQGNLRLVVAAELWRIMKFYGEFGLILPLLDGGHILAQLQMELEQIGMKEAQIRYGAKEEAEYKRLGLSPKSNLITLEIDFGKIFVCHMGKCIEGIYERSINYDKEVSSYEIAGKLLAFEKSFPTRPLICSQNKLIPFANTQKRESAHNYVGICSLQEIVLEKTVIDYTTQLQQYMNHYMDDLDNYGVYVIYHTQQGHKLLQIHSGQLLPPKNIVVDKTKLLHDTQKMIDMKSMPITVYISYKYQDALSEKENIYNAHMGAAEICHFFLLNGPKDGMFGRPMRNLEDAYVEKLFEADDKERFMYSLIMGWANTKNYVQRLEE